MVHNVCQKSNEYWAPKKYKISAKAMKVKSRQVGHVNVVKFERIVYMEVLDKEIWNLKFDLKGSAMTWKTNFCQIKQLWDIWQDVELYYKIYSLITFILNRKNGMMKKINVGQFLLKLFFYFFVLSWQTRCNSLLVKIKGEILV